MSVTPGLYFVTYQEARLSRFMVEDLSLRPKRVYLLPDQMHSTPLNIESAEDGKFFIAQMGARYGKAHGDDNVVALLIPDMGTVGQYEFKSKGNGYTISMENQYIHMSNDDGPAGKLARYVGEGQASVFTLVKVG